MALKEPYRKKPDPLRKPWPPPDYKLKKEVTLADNWDTLAAGRDPWRIILYNFKTHNPDEVNWYLYHRIGCRAVTPDGKNYRFGPYDDRLPAPPGAPKKLYIYIPHDDWEPEYDDLARELVYETLLSSSARAVHFSTSVASLHLGEIGNVGLLVGKGHIQVVHSPGLTSHNAGARYVQKGDVMELGSLRTDNGARSRIVHEAVHAAFDSRRAYLTAIEEEAVAYVAQCFYLQLVSTKTLPTSNFDWKPIAEKAWPIATAKRTGASSSAADWEALKQQIVTSYPHLAATPYKGYTHDGVGA